MLDFARTWRMTKGLLGGFSNFLAIVAVLFFGFNFSFAAWSINPIYDFLFARTAGWILPANHVSSCFLVVGITAWFAFRDYRHALRWLFVIFSSVSIHEILLDLIMTPTWWDSPVRFF